MTGRTIFLGGCPASGKSHIAEAVVAARSSVKHVVAGQLIRGALTSAGLYERPLVADGATADKYQLLLIDQFRMVRSEHCGDILLDGHFVVPTREGPHPVPAEVFAELCVDIYVLLETRSDVIVERLALRDGSPWWDGSWQQVENLASDERDHAKVVAEHQRRGLVILRGDSSDALANVLRVVDRPAAKAKPDREGPT